MMGNAQLDVQRLVSVRRNIQGQNTARLISTFSDATQLNWHTRKGKR